MEDLKNIVSRKTAVIIISIILLFMVVGSIWDYQISQALYNPQNPFGIFFAAYGELPAMLGLITSGLLLVLGRKTSHTPTAIFQVFSGGLLFLLGTAMALFLPGDYLNIAKSLQIAISIVIIATVVFLTIRLCKDSSREMMIKVALAIFIVIFLEMLLVNLIKVLWGRPRMRLITEDSQAYFTSWWVAGGSLKKMLIPLGIASEEFKSFPSGHTASGASLMLMCLLPVLSSKLKGRGVMLFYIGAAWGLLVAFSRIIMGAHFITDVTVSFTVTYAIISVTLYFMFLYDSHLK